MISRAVLRQMRKRYPLVLGHPLVFTMGVAAFLVSSIEFAVPGFVEESRPAEVGGMFAAYAWLFSAWLGGILICVGLALRTPKLEVPGLILVACAMAIQVACVLSVAPVRGLFGAGIQAGFTLGCVVRAWMVTATEGNGARGH